MGTAELEGPTIEQFAGGIEDEDVVLLVIGEEEEAAVSGLDHFVAVFDGVTGGGSLAPVFLDAITEVAMADGDAIGGIGFALRLDEWSAEKGSSGGGEEMAARGHGGGRVDRCCSDEFEFFA